MRGVRSLAAAASIGASLVLLQALRRRRASSGADRSQTTDDQVQHQSQGASHVGGEHVLPRPRTAKLRRTFAVCILAASAGLSGVALWAIHTLHPITGNALHPLTAGISVIAALAMSAFLLRGPREQSGPRPRQRNGSVATFIAAILFIAQFGAALFVVIEGVFYVYDPAVILQLTMLGVAAVGIALCLLATWISGWPFAGPLATGIVAASLGALCVPGLETFAAPLQAPNINGAGELFVTGSSSPSQKVLLSVTADPLDLPPNQEEQFAITNEENRSINWVLLLVGDARLVPSTISLYPVPGISEYRTSNKNGTRCGHELFVSNPETIVPSPACAQLFSGSVVPTASVNISGRPYGTLVSNNFANSVVSLPTYGQGSLFDLSNGTGASIVKELGATPTTANVAMTIYGSSIGPLESVSQSAPAMTTDPNYPGGLEWTSNIPIAPSYTITYQDSAAEVSNFLFVFAILLGVAGAGILASLQGAIQVLLERRATIRRHSTAGR
jgi:hypothetical protein